MTKGDDMQTFSVTYFIPRKGSFTEHGLTREGVRSLMDAILRAGGHGFVQ